jgi:hypothetical protein
MHEIRMPPGAGRRNRSRGEVEGARYSPVDAFYATAEGDVVFLEQPQVGAPKTLAEIEQKRAESKQRQAVGATLLLCGKCAKLDPHLAACHAIATSASTAPATAMPRFT